MPSSPATSDLPLPLPLHPHSGGQNGLVVPIIFTPADDTDINTPPASGSTVPSTSNTTRTRDREGSIGKSGYRPNLTHTRSRGRSITSTFTSTSPSLNPTSGILPTVPPLPQGITALAYQASLIPSSSSSTPIFASSSSSSTGHKRSFPVGILHQPQSQPQAQAPGEEDMEVMSPTTLEEYHSRDVLGGLPTGVVGQIMLQGGSSGSGQPQQLQPGTTGGRRSLGHRSSSFGQSMGIGMPSTVSSASRVVSGGSGSVTGTSTPTDASGGKVRLGLNRRISTPNMRKAASASSASTAGVSTTNPGPGKIEIPAINLPIGASTANQLSPLGEFSSSIFNGTASSSIIRPGSTRPTQQQQQEQTHFSELVEGPSTSAAAGAYIAGAWMLGKAIGRAVGFNVLSPGKGKARELSAEGEDDETSPERSSSMGIGMGILDSSDDGRESKRSSTETWDWASSGSPITSVSSSSTSNNVNLGPYFGLPPGEEYAPGLSLPTPASSSKSLSGRPAPINTQVGRGRGRAVSVTEKRIDSFNNLKEYLFGSGAKAKSSPVPDYLKSPKLDQYGYPKDRKAADLGLDQQGEQTVDMGVALRDVVRELGWTLGMLGLFFVVSLGVVAMLVTSLPITSLKSIPKQVSDLQILSAEIRSYMASGSTGWWHTVIVLAITGMWKHSWSVPGAVILNILVGSLLPPISALLLLTVITSFGSLGAYLLSRPLAPLIALMLPKPLAIVRSAIGGVSSSAESIPMTRLSSDSDRADDFSVKDDTKPNVWRRLLIMRAMGLVPWSGMNVACGVVGVSWTTFLLTTAAGSASWSYVTASIGDILAKIALPAEALARGLEAASPLVAPLAGEATNAAVSGGTSLTSLLRDPALILKLVILSALSALPVLFKSRSDQALSAPPPTDPTSDQTNYKIPLLSASDQAMTPLAPTPSVYYMFYVARNVTRKSLRSIEGLYKGVMAVVIGATNENEIVVESASSRRRG